MTQRHDLGECNKYMIALISEEAIGECWPI